MSGRVHAEAQAAPKSSFAPVQTDLLQRSSASHAGPATVPPIVHEVLRSPGQPLAPETRASMELRFGHDFNSVRIHADTQAEQSAHLLNANAYTINQQIVFGAGRYSPYTPAGQKLLAHELTHVVQQSRAGSKRNGLINRAGDTLDAEADHVAARIGTSQTVEVSTAVTPPMVQRDVRAIGETREGAAFVRGLFELDDTEEGVQRQSLEAYLRYFFPLVSDRDRQIMLRRLLRVAIWTSHPREGQIWNLTIPRGDHQSGLEAYRERFTQRGRIRASFEVAGQEFIREHVHMMEEATRPVRVTTAPEQEQPSIGTEGDEEWIESDEDLAAAAREVPNGEPRGEGGIGSILGGQEAEGQPETGDLDVPSQESPSAEMEQVSAPEGSRFAGVVEERDREFARHFLIRNRIDMTGAAGEAPNLIITQSMITAWREVQRLDSDARERFFARLHDERASHEGPVTARTFSNVLSDIEREEALSRLDPEALGGEVVEPPPVNRPVQGRIRMGPDRFVYADREMEFYFQLEDPVPVHGTPPSMTVLWYVTQLGLDGWSDPIKSGRTVLDATAIVNPSQHTFDYCFTDAGGLYKVHADVRHNHYRRKHFKRTVYVPSSRSRIEAMSAEFTGFSGEGTYENVEMGGDESGMRGIFQLGEDFRRLSYEDQIGALRRTYFERTVYLQSSRSLIEAMSETASTGFSGEGTYENVEIGGDESSMRGIFQPREDFRRLSCEGQIGALRRERQQVEEYIERLEGQQDDIARRQLEWARNYLASLQGYEGEMQSARELGAQYFQVRGVFLSRSDDVSSQETMRLIAHATLRRSGDVTVDIYDHSHTFSSERLGPFTGDGNTFDDALQEAFVRMCGAYPPGVMEIRAERLAPPTRREQDVSGVPASARRVPAGQRRSAGERSMGVEQFVPTGDMLGLRLDCGSAWEEIREVVWDEDVQLAVNIGATVTMVFLPCTAPVLLPLIALYQVTDTVARMQEESERGTLTSGDVNVGLGLIALDVLMVLPLFTRAGRAIGGRVWYAIDRGEDAAEGVLLTREGINQLEQFRDGTVRQIAERQAIIEELRSEHPNDPRIAQLEAECGRLATRARYEWASIAGRLVGTHIAMRTGVRAMRHVGEGRMQRAVTDLEGERGLRQTEAVPMPRPRAEALEHETVSEMHTMAGTRGGAPSSTGPSPTRRHRTPVSTRSEYFRQQHEEQIARLGTAPERPGTIAVTDITPLPPGRETYLYGYDQFADAHRFYQEALVRARGREVGIYRNIDTGEYGVRVGDETTVTRPPGNWGMVLHYHPIPQNVLTLRNPSTTDLRLSTNQAREANHPITAFIEFPIPGGLRGRTMYRVDPDGRIRVEYTEANGRVMVEEYANMEDYRSRSAYFERTFYMDPEGPIHPMRLHAPSHGHAMVGRRRLSEEELQERTRRRQHEQSRRAVRQQPDPEQQIEIGARRQADDLYEQARSGAFIHLSQTEKVRLLNRFERLMHNSGAPTIEINRLKGDFNEFLHMSREAFQTGRTQPEYLAGVVRVQGQGRRGTTRPEESQIRHLSSGEAIRVHINEKADIIHQMDVTATVQRARRYTDDAEVQAYGAQTQATMLARGVPLPSGGLRRRQRRGPWIGPLPAGEFIVIRYTHRPSREIQEAMVQEHFRVGSPIIEVHFGSTVYNNPNLP